MQIFESFPSTQMGGSASLDNKNLQQGSIISSSCYHITQMPEQRGAAFKLKMFS